MVNVFNGLVIAPVAPTTSDIIRVTLTSVPGNNAVKVVVDEVSAGVSEYFIAGHGKVAHIPEVVLGAGGVEYPVSMFTDEIDPVEILYSSACLGGSFSEWKKIDLTDQVIQEPVIVTAAPILSAPIWQVDQVLTYTPATYTGDAGTVTTICNSYPFDGITPVVIAIPANLTGLADRQLEIVTSIVQLNGNPDVVTSSGKTPRIMEVPVEPVVRPATIVPADFTILRSERRPAGGPDNQYPYSPVWIFHGLVGRNVDGLRWTTTDWADPPLEHREIFAMAGGTAINYGTINWATAEVHMYMTDPAKRNPLAVPKVDYAVFDNVEAGIRTEDIRVEVHQVGLTEWSLLSAFISAPEPMFIEPPVPEPGDPAGAWQLRPVSHRPSFDNGVTPDFPAFYTNGKYFGAGYQANHGGDRVGQTILKYGDMHGPTHSKDGGVTYNRLRALGHHAFGANFARIDPDDEDRYILCGAKLWTGGVNGSNAVISLSTDAGFTCSHTQVFANGARDGFSGNHRGINRACDCWPKSGGSPAARTWRAMIFMDSFQSNVTLLTSTNGGQSWTDQIIAGWFGRRVHWFEQSPHAALRGYAACADGIFKTEDGGVTWGPALVTGSWQFVWEDPDVSGRLIALRHTDGVWFRANAGAGWVNKLSRNYCVALGVGPKIGGVRKVWMARHLAADNHGDRAFYINSWTTSGDLGTSWARSTHTQYDPSDTSEHWRIEIGGDGQAFYFDPANANKVVVEGAAVPWATDNGGHFVMRSTNYHGEYGQGMGLDEYDPDFIGIGISDVYLFLSFNRGRSFTKAGSNMASFFPGGNSPSCNGIMRLGPSSSAPRRLFALVGNNFGNTNVVWMNSNGTVWAAASGLGTGSRSFMGFSLQNHDLLYIHNARSANAGGAWVGLAYAIVGINRLNGTQVVGHDGGAGNFYKSNDAGSTWAFWFNNGGVDVRYVSNNVFALSPLDYNKAISKTPGNEVMLRNGATQVNNLGLRAFIATLPTMGGTVPSYFNITGLEWSPLDPRKIIVSAYMPGGYVIFEGTLAADYLSCTWKDRSMNVPRLNQGLKSKMHMKNGECFFLTSGGTWCMAPLTGAVTDGSSIWTGLPKPMDGVLFPAPV